MTTLAVIVGNRGFFPSHLAKTGRETILRVLEEEGFGAVCLTPDDTEHGAVVTFEDSVKCAKLFKAHAEEIDGILVTLPNFGEERGIADAIRLSGLDVPVLVQATPDDLSKMDINWRRDSFCGKMSACNNMTQYGIKYSLTTLHTVDPESESFRQDLQTFGAVCRVVNGLRRARFGQVGARPAAFITVRYSEKLLEKAGISVESIDLSEVFGKAWKLADDAPEVVAKVAAIKGYLGTEGIGGSSAQAGQAGRCPGCLCRRAPTRWHGGSVLDIDGRVLWCGALHRDEHDEQHAQAQRLRDGHRGPDRDVCHGFGLWQAQRDPGLEQ